MKSIEEFTNLIDGKLNNIKDADIQREKQRKEDATAFAEACIDLMFESIKQLSDEKRSAHITIKKPIFGDYYVDGEDYSSSISIQDDVVSIHLLYGYMDHHLSTPTLLDKDLVDKLLEPYCVSVKKDGGSADATAGMYISYDRKKKKSARKVQENTPRTESRPRALG